MQKQYKRYLFLFAVLAALLMGMSGTGAVFAQGHARLASSQKADVQSCGAWSVVTSPNVASSDNELYGVSAVSTSDIWAGGYYSNINVGQPTLIEQSNGTHWRIAKSPNARKINDDILRGVSADSVSDVWAVGDYLFSEDHEQTLIEHWNGTNWRVVASPNPGSGFNILWGVAAVSPSDVWAVGDSDDGTLIEHWDGTSWSIFPSPASSGVLSGVTAISASDIWAVGWYYPGNTTQTLIEHWDGTSWSIVPSPNPDPNVDYLFGVAAVSSSDVWAVGYSFSGSVTEHWNGTSWSVVPSNVSGTFYGVAAVSSSDVWAVGDYENNSAGPFQTFTEQWNGTSWSVVSSPNVGSGNNILMGVTAVSGDVWAVGTANNQTLVEFYC